MHTDHLFEQWNTDPASIVATVHRLLGPCDVLLGGSLADGLGTAGSDVDLYCFREPCGAPSRFPLLEGCGDATLELHIVDVPAEPGGPDDLRPLLTDPEPRTPREWPLLSPQRFRQMHALYRGQALHAAGPAEAARRAWGADLVHLYAGLRAAFTAGTLAEDLVAFPGPEHATARLYCARLTVESAIDAALATCTLVNPNPKWRLLLAGRARLADPGFPDPDRLLAALFPAASAPDRAVAYCLEVAAECLRLVLADGILSRFPAVRASADLVESAAGSPLGSA
jgi:hypothetical protein